MSNRPGGRSAGLAAVSPVLHGKIGGTVGQVSAAPDCTPCAARLVARPDDAALHRPADARRGRRGGRRQGAV